MSTTPSYASNLFLGSGTTTTADTSTTQPTESTVGVICTAQSNGARVDQLDIICLGTSVQGLLRLWECAGEVGALIASITFVGTTATVTTQTSHGLSTGARITLQGAFPSQYNVKNVAITVTGLTTFTYTMSTAPTINAIGMGQYSGTPAVPVYTLKRELPITAIVGSTTTPAWQQAYNSRQNQSWLPILLPAAYSLRSTVSVTQTNPIMVGALGGNG